MATAAAVLDFNSLLNIFSEHFPASLTSKSVQVLSHHLKPLHNDAVKTPESLIDFKSTIDSAFRHQLTQLTNNEGENDLNIQLYEDVINLAIAAAKEGLAGANLPVTLLGDLFDVKPLPECEKLFFLVEDRVDEWKSETFFKNIKNQLLRTCNDLLRRLSRSQNTIFCGRILIFLARFFPLFERSGLNLIGEFNRENTVTISSQNESEPETPMDTSNASGDLEEGEMSNEPAVQIDYGLYSKFWQLQDFFRQPQQCYNRLEWKRFISCSSEVLSAFASMKLDTQGPLSNIEELTTEESYFAKYLTNQKLFELQLSDSNFRRYILLQFLIAFQYLTSSVKFKLDSQVLTDEQKEWVNETTDKVYELISQTPPRGKEMMKAVTQILQREESWNMWKNDGCPEIKPDEVAGKEKRKSSANVHHVGFELLSAEKGGKFSLGNRELTRLWNLCPDNWQACKSRKRVFTPTVEEYFDSIVRMPKETRIKKITGDPSFTWRGLRLLSQKSPHFFTPSNQIVRPLHQYMDSVVDTLGKVMNVQPPSGEPAEDAEDISDDDFLRVPEDSGHSNSVNASPRGDCAQNGHEDNITKEMLPALAGKIVNCWKECAKAFTFDTDEIEFFESQASDPEKQAEGMLQVWFEQFPEDTDMKTLREKLARAGCDVQL